MEQFSLPPGYERKKQVLRPKLGPWLGIIDQILVDDKAQHKKQRHTAKRIFDRLKAEHAFSGGYTIVKDYVRQARLTHKEVFVPLAHPPGDAQADFGEALVVIAGVEQKAHFQCFDLPYSDDCFVIAFPAEGLVGYARRNFLVPAPRVATWEELNAHLRQECVQRRARKLWGHQETIAERFERDREKFLLLPPTPCEACEKRTTRASSLGPGAIRDQRLFSAHRIRPPAGAAESLRVGGGDLLLQ